MREVRCGHLGGECHPTIESGDVFILCTDCFHNEANMDIATVCALLGELKTFFDKNKIQALEFDILSPVLSLFGYMSSLLYAPTCMNWGSHWTW